MSATGADEMVSGPDLGAGFLFQLTRRPEGGGARYVFHAQDGGSDAGGPPKGSPEPLGYAHPPSYCGFGGPRCWHREFVLPEDAPARVRSAYNRTRFVMEAMVGASLSGSVAPVAPALAEITTRIGSPEGATSLAWCVGGSTALLLHDLQVTPADIDVATDGAGVGSIATSLEPYLIEPPAATEWPPARAVVGARAFLGSFREGCRVEWAAAEPASPVDLSREALRHRRAVTTSGRAVPVTPLELLAARAWKKLGPSGWGLYVQRLAAVGFDAALLRLGSAADGLPEERARELQDLAAR